MGRPVDQLAPHHHGAAHAPVAVNEAGRCVLVRLVAHVLLDDVAWATRHLVELAAVVDPEHPARPFTLTGLGDQPPAALLAEALHARRVAGVRVARLVESLPLQPSAGEQLVAADRQNLRRADQWDRTRLPADVGRPNGQHLEDRLDPRQDRVDPFGLAGAEEPVDEAGIIGHRGDVRAIGRVEARGQGVDTGPHDPTGHRAQRQRLQDALADVAADSEHQDVHRVVHWLPRRRSQSSGHRVRPVGRWWTGRHSSAVPSCAGASEPRTRR